MGLFSRFLTKSPSSKSAVAAGWVDPSAMTTEVGREIAARINRAVEASGAQSRRLLEVVKLFYSFSDTAQFDLSEAAIIWACVALARHERCDECKTHFYAFVDALYGETNDAIKKFSDSDRQKMIADAYTLERSLLPAVNEILPASLKKLATYDSENLFRLTADALHHVRKRELEHAPRDQLIDLTVHCVMLAGGLKGYDLGAVFEEEVSTEAKLVFNMCIWIMDSVNEAVRTGKLLVKDGKIIAAGQAGA